MLSHRFSTDIKRQIKTLYVYDNYHGLIALLSSYLLIALAIIAAEKFPYLLPLSLIIIGSRQRALATLLHEASHSVLAKNKTLNRILGEYFAGNLVFQSWSSYKRSHVVDHHQKLGDPDKDPDLQYYIAAGMYLKKTRQQMIVQHLLVPALFLNAFSSLKYLVIHRLLRASRPIELITITTTHCMLAAAGSYFFGLELYVLYWLVPYLTVFQAITWFIELAEHYPIVKDAKYSLYATRNRFSHPLEHFLTAMHGENFHLIHHLFPSIPFWNMKRAHRILLQDKDYARINASFGGIFLSSNFAASMWSTLISDPTPEISAGMNT